MWFSDPLEPGFSTARVLTSSGSEVQTGPVRLATSDPHHMILPIGRLAPGFYTVTWQTVSQADGHQWYGSFPFTVLNPDGSEPTGSTTTVSGENRVGTTRRKPFCHEGAYLSQVGEWDLSVYVRRRGMEDTLAEVSLNVPAPAADDPWQNPIPQLPSGLLAAGVLVALGAIPLVLGRSIQKERGQTAAFTTAAGGLILLGGIVIAIGMLPALLASADTSTAQSPQSIAAGADLYRERCAACHGPDGTGAGPMAAELATPPADLRVHVPVHTDRELYRAIKRGIQGTAMPSYERRLTDEEIWLLVDYLRASFDTPH